jgi:DNA polymerase-1
MEILPCPTMAVIDADIIAYRTAFRAETDDPAFIPQMVEEQLENWLPAETEDFVMALSCSRKDNYRRDFWPIYKATRDVQATPEYLGEVKEYIREIYTTEEIPRLEADDIMGMAASSGRAVAVTIDKDLKTVPGWHFNPDKDDAPVHITQEESEESFLIQWMTGDNTDNIPGLWRVGPKRAKSFLRKWEDLDYEEEIITLYSNEKFIPKKTCDLEDLDLALAMARCVRILRNGDYDEETGEVSLWNPKVGV